MGPSNAGVPDVPYLPYSYPVRLYVLRKQAHPLWPGPLRPRRFHIGSLPPFLPLLQLASPNFGFSHPLPCPLDAFLPLSHRQSITGSCGHSGPTSSPKSRRFSVPTASFLIQANIHFRLEGHISQQSSPLGPIFHIAEGSLFPGEHSSGLPVPLV